MMHCWNISLPASTFLWIAKVISRASFFLRKSVLFHVIEISLEAERISKYWETLLLLIYSRRGMSVEFWLNWFIPTPTIFQVWSIWLMTLEIAEKNTLPGLFLECSVKIWRPKPGRKSLSLHLPFTKQVKRMESNNINICEHCRSSPCLWDKYAKDVLAEHQI